MAKYCTNCGAPIEEGMITCISCGASIYDDTQYDQIEETKEELIEEAPATEENNAGAEEDTAPKRYCHKCGKPVDKDAVICMHCGCTVDGKSPNAQEDSDSIGWGFLGFFVPIVGLILWLMWKDTMPKKAKKLGIGALISVCLSGVGSVVGSVFSFLPALFI